MSIVASVLADHSLRVNGKRGNTEAMLDYTTRTKHANKFSKALGWLDINLGSRPLLQICTVRKYKHFRGFVVVHPLVFLQF